MVPEASPLNPFADQPARIICPGLFGTSAPQWNIYATICVHSGPKRTESHDFVSKNDRLGKLELAKASMMVEVNGIMVWKGVTRSRETLTCSSLYRPLIGLIPAPGN
jgi:hypothetical protein